VVTCKTRQRWTRSDRALTGNPSDRARLSGNISHLCSPLSHRGRTYTWLISGNALTVRKQTHNRFIVLVKVLHWTFRFPCCLILGCWQQILFVVWVAGWGLCGLCSLWSTQQMLDWIGESGNFGDQVNNLSYLLCSSSFSYPDTVACQGSLLRFDVFVKQIRSKSFKCSCKLN